MEVSRIRELLEARQLSPTQFADLIGVGRPVISHILSGRNEPSLKVVRSIIEAFPDIALAWIMTGTGPMLAASAPTAPAATPPALPASQPLQAAPATFPALVVAPPPIAPPAPTIYSPVLPAPQVLAAPAPVPIANNTPAAPIQQLSQPPRFRPLAKAAPQLEPRIAAPAPPPAPDPVLVTTHSLPTASLAAALAAASPTLPEAPTPAPGLSVLASSGVPPVPAEPMAAPVELPVPPPASVYSPSPESLAAPPIASHEATPAPANLAAPAAVTQPNAAAAFSFLGEAGKTIRRIVLFYNDGSFSDYRPEGQ